MEIRDVWKKGADFRFEVIRLPFEGSDNTGGRPPLKKKLNFMSTSPLYISAVLSRCRVKVDFLTGKVRLQLVLKVHGLMHDKFSLHSKPNLELYHIK